MTERLPHHILFTIRSIPAFGIIGSFKMFLAFRLGVNLKLQPKGYPHPINVRGRTSDPLLAYNIFTRKEYPAIDDSSIGLVIDGGANVGFASIYFARHYPKARIVAVEPEHSNFIQLKKNTEAYPNIVPLEKGLWFRKANLKVENPSAEKWGFTFTETGADGVPCVTVPSLLDEHHTSGSVLVKMDIEGAEKQIFAQDSSWVARVGYILIEIHGGWKIIFDAMSRYKYDAWISTENVIIKLLEKPASETGGGPQSSVKK